MKAIERIKQYIDYKGLNNRVFELENGLSNGYIATQLKRNADLGESVLNKILDNCLDINVEWLLTGKGVMLKPEIQTENTLTVHKLKTDKILDNQDIPLYDVQVAAGVVDLFGGGEKQIPVDYIRIPKLPKCDGALYVTGDSMYPLLKSGDIVMYKEIYNIEHNIVWGEMYLIYVNNDGNEYFFTKFLKKSEREGYVCFVSQNQHHQTIEFPITSIKALALVKASIRINSQV